MSDRPLKLLLIDQDPIFRLGLRVALEAIPNLEAIAVVETDTVSLQILAEIAEKDPNQVNLVVLEFGNSRSTTSQQLGLQFCRQLRALYPNLPILLLSSIQEQGLLLAAKSIGVNGYCPKGTPLPELVAAMQEVADGGSYWFQDREAIITPNSSLLTPNSSFPFSKLRNNLRLSGIANIDATLAAVTTQLQTPGLPVLDRAILAGQRRELLAARWLLNRLLVSPQERQKEQIPVVDKPPLTPLLSSAIQQRQTVSPLLSPGTLQSALFTSCVTKLQLPLRNVTDIPLEIDIFREDKKRELLYLILQKLAEQLDELRTSQIEINQLHELKHTLIRDLWQAAIIDFFGKFSRIKIVNQNIEIVNLLLQNIEVVQRDILNRIPLVDELYSYLLFQTELNIDNNSYPVVSAEANSQALMILENLLIQVANGVVQPLLNYLADVEEIKQNFYGRQFISTREIERFRNDLSWKHRLKNYINEPKAVFESRYELFVIAPRGIANTSVYAPRNQELVKLSNIPLVVTLLLEFSDAIAPRLKSLLAVFGSGIVFILTQIVGRGLGLVGRGILQGIGSVSSVEKNFRRNSDRPK
ncbi:regulator [Nostoc punctiforme NIES-2108]|uniref:Regulator n=1 Tax=Nostoc punctiforme NIES-2108 TaxID=1356359 RepID=A0A367RN98_NOSPU|nr:regulator [Nostoc punctiforme NIES-2108]